jgi:hypothetical protein
VTGIGDKISVAGTSDWMTAGFPSLLPMKLQKIENKNGVTVAQFVSETNKLILLKVVIQPGIDVAKAINQLFVMDGSGSPATSAYKTAALRALGEKNFTGELAAVSLDDRVVILTAAQDSVHALSIGTEQYKGTTYLAMGLGSGDFILNDIQFSQAGLIAHTFNNRLIMPLKASAIAINGKPVPGVKFNAVILHRDFLREGNLAPHLDLLSV